MKSFLVLFIFAFSFSAIASLEIPKKMNSGERKKALEILGFSSAAKLLGNPYPLGGYSGMEIGYTTEVISTGELARLGDKASAQGETSYSVLTIGKGLYNNVDFYVQFTPFTQSEAISNFGGQIRWGFYQSAYLPAHLSAVVFANSTNFQNKISTVSQGEDLIAGFSVQDVTLYTGLGIIRTSGNFMGGAAAVTDTGDTAQEEVTQSHYLAGINIKFSKMFLAMEIDRYSQSTYSAKLGVRF
jgi:hypothetical protein